MRKNLGAVRKIDKLGRIVIPKEMRRILHVCDSDALDISFANDEIQIRKYETTCIFCKEETDTVTYKGHKICRNCIEKIYKTSKV
jgi:transcriptional pleiotropic regulator of transition state genes